jgi:hypothetical protein
MEENFYRTEFLQNDNFCFDKNRNFPLNKFINSDEVHDKNLQHNLSSSKSFNKKIKKVDYLFAFMQTK